MAAPEQINIGFYTNEDCIRQFTLKSGDATQSTPYDLTDVSFEMDVRDQKGALVLHLDSSEGGGISVTDAANGIFQIHIGVGQIAYVATRSLSYDLLMVAGGDTKRLWGGSLYVKAGVTVPA